MGRHERHLERERKFAAVKLRQQQAITQAHRKSQEKIAAKKERQLRRASKLKARIDANRKKGRV